MINHVQDQQPVQTEEDCVSPKWLLGKLDDDFLQGFPSSFRPNPVSDNRNHSSFIGPQLHIPFLSPIPDA
jgi:hypothetical protein